MKHRRSGLAAIALLVVCAMALRLYGMPAMMRFHDDQGLDLLVVRLMERTGYRPLVGPYLTVADVFNPPTYYYVTWFAYRMTHLVEGIVRGYFLLNMLSLLLLLKLSWDMGGLRHALAAGFLFSVNGVMIGHGRSFWQPYPMTFFLYLFLYLLWHARLRGRFIILWLALLSYGFALSVYPSAVLLVPYVLFQAYRWYRTVYGFGTVKSGAYSLLTAGTACAVPFLPLIVYERLHGFPTLTAFTFGATNVWDTARKLDKNLLELFLSFFPLRSMPAFSWWFAVSAGIGLYLVGTVRVQSAVRSFIAFGALAAGLVFFFFQQTEVYSHHGWAYLPFLFLYAGSVIARGISSSPGKRAAVTVMLLLFVSANLRSVRPLFNPYVTDNISEVRALADFVRADMKARGIPKGSVRFFHTIPEDADGYDENVYYRVMYWLAESGDLDLPLTPEGNNFRLPVREGSTNAYLFCIRYPPAEPNTGRDACADKILRGRPHVIVTRETIGTVTVLAVAMLPQNGIVRSITP